jgi:hypothetical protein
MVVDRLRRSLLPGFQKAWNRDLDARLKAVRADLEDMAAELHRLRRANRRLEVLHEWNEARPALFHDLDARLSLDRIRPHILNAVDRADLATDPTSHLVIERLLPDDFYALLLEAIPPTEFFPDRDPVKQDLEMEALSSAPRFTQRVWKFFDEEVVPNVLAPALFSRLRDAVVGHYEETGGPVFASRAAALAHLTSSGRVMLRRPGYHLKPHLDPKRVVITGLMYLARPGDSEEYGTRLFRVDRPFVASGMKTFYPEDAGYRCEVARTVPFRRNTLLAFVNSKAAHGASLPPDAPLHERFAYQFYIKPPDRGLTELLRELPAEASAAWSGLLATGHEAARSEY